MRFRSMILFSVAALLACGVSANDKKKPILPASILKARSVAVVIDPDAGVSPDAPLANRTAAEDVEKVLEKWGRFKLVMSGMSADIVIVIRKGNGKLVQPTIHGRTPSNDRPVVIQPNDTGIRIGGQQGRAPTDPQNDPQGDHPGEGAGIGATEDSFAVYDGTADDPTSQAPIWRYVAKDALHSHDVPAVDLFRKIVEETEKQLQKQQQKKP